MIVDKKIIKGIIRCPNIYKDGTESVEINFPLNYIDYLPVIKNQRVIFNLNTPVNFDINI